MSYIIVEVDGRRLRCTLSKNRRGVFIGWPGASRLISSDDAQARSEKFDGTVRAPMAGRITKLEVDDGAQVDTGALLLIMEAMKMEYRVTAPEAGRVEGLAARVGELVDVGATLLKLRP